MAKCENCGRQINQVKASMVENTPTKRFTEDTWAVPSVPETWIPSNQARSYQTVPALTAS
jgi:hypothetical protein